MDAPERARRRHHDRAAERPGADATTDPRTWDAALDRAVSAQLDALWAGVAPSPDVVALREALHDAGQGGKRVRPRLVAAVHDAMGGRQPAAVVEAAAAVELLHTAFVIHDDLIDQDDLRRGRPSVLGRFRANGWGGAPARGTYARAGAVLTGDLALAAAVAGFARLPISEPERAGVMSVVAPALADSATGELADVRLALEPDPSPTDAEVLDLAARKTSAYSFELPMQVGAILAGADQRTVATIGRAGRALGIAFQLNDDLAGMFDDEAETGKDPLSDLREGKLTMLISHARTTPSWPAIAPHWGDPRVGLPELYAVRRALTECGSRAHVATVADAHLRTGLDLAHDAGLDPRATGWLAGLLSHRTEDAA